MAYIVNRITISLNCWLFYFYKIACMHACMHVYVYVYVYVCMDVCMYAANRMPKLIDYKNTIGLTIMRNNRPTNRSRTYGLCMQLR